jgi:type I restriction-modification system DNA methylase subunit
VVEEKPEVRKAGGVYYTPQYIVDYIVQQTVGKLVDGKKPEHVAKLRIVDPACGSGSFLIGAYNYLLNWHQAYYKPEWDRLSAIASSTEYNLKARNDAVKERNKLPLTPDGALATALKKRILLNNLYGVDIDTQAVEVTKLSLLLKCMEGETHSSITAELRFGERVLPTLDQNIKSGNSLIDLDFYDGTFDFEPGAEKKIKPFSWQQAFPDIFKRGGFDAVIGNPPYIRIQSIIETSPQQAEYLSNNYQSASKGNYDLYVVFLEKALSLISSNGRVGFILPHKFFNAQYGEGIRKVLLDTKAIDEIIHFGH